MRRIKRNKFLRMFHFFSLFQSDYKIRLSNLDKVGSFMQICSKRINIWDPNLSNFYKEMYGRGQGLPPCIYFFVKICKFQVSYFNNFARDSFEISYNYTKTVMNWE